MNIVKNNMAKLKTKLKKIIKIRWAWHVACMRKKGRNDSISVLKPDRKRPSGRSRLTGKPNIKCILNNVMGGRGLLESTGSEMTQWRGFFRTVMNFRLGGGGGIY